MTQTLLKAFENFAHTAMHFSSVVSHLIQTAQRRSSPVSLRSTRKSKNGVRERPFAFLGKRNFSDNDTDVFMQKCKFLESLWTCVIPIMLILWIYEKQCTPSKIYFQTPITHFLIYLYVLAPL